MAVLEVLIWCKKLKQKKQSVFQIEKNNNLDLF